MVQIMLKTFNPIKSYQLTEIHQVLSNIISQANKDFVIYNDNIGYYFAPLRGHGVSLWLDDPKYYNMFQLLQSDIYLTKTVFKEMMVGFHWDLLEHFEERSYTEKNPLVQSFLLFCLHNLSSSEDSSFAMYDKERVSKLQENINKLEQFYIKENSIFFDMNDKEKFIISVEKEFEHNEGLLITKQRDRKKDLIKSFGSTNIYYIPKRY